jgi:glycosyltransferase involved in cell wall biosynthesis
LDYLSTFLPRIHFIANCVYGSHLAGGDIHFFEMARAAAEAGWEVNFFGGFALKEHVAAQELSATVTLTEERQRQIDGASLRGQIDLFRDYLNRYRGTIRQLSAISADDAVYSTTDYWFDVLPAVKSAARSKMMIWHMQAPTFGQVITRGRADVDRFRVASLHYWASQKTSLATFRRCPVKRILYVHPDMRDRLLTIGFGSTEMTYVSFGVDPTPASIGERREKVYDAVWIGRVHRQKGIEDLLSTLEYLNGKVPGFRALIIGKVKSDLEPIIAQRGLSKAVELSGFVSEHEKFQLFESSRVFLMPSRFEGSPRVIGEALVCRLPVIAYNVPTYRPVFGEFLRYIPCYDVDRFGAEAEEQILKMRGGENYLESLPLKIFVQECSWEAARKKFLNALGEISTDPMKEPA